MEKVEEPNVEETCHQDYCGDCVDKIKVDFYIADAPDGYNQKEIQWEDLLVCPWCYNQLVEKYQK